MFKQRINGLASFLAVAALALALTGPALAKSDKAQNDKRPGQTCQGTSKADHAFSDCVKAQAHTTKDERKAAKSNQGGNGNSQGHGNNGQGHGKKN